MSSSSTFELNYNDYRFTKNGSTWRVYQSGGLVGTFNDYHYQNIDDFKELQERAKMWIFFNRLDGGFNA